MIRAKSEQIIDAMQRFSAIPYMEAGARDEKSMPGFVCFDIVIGVLKHYQTPEKRIVTDENNNPVPDPETGRPKIETVTRVTPRIEMVRKEQAVFKKDTFYTVIGGGVLPENYDLVLMDQIEYVNTKTWTGQEIQKRFFWNLRLTDMEVVTPEMLEDLTRTYILEDEQNN